MKTFLGLLKIFVLISLTKCEILLTSPEEFPLLTHQYPNQVALFFNPNSTICQRFLEHYEKAASFIENSGYNIVFSLVNMSLPGEKPFDDLKVYPNIRVFLENKEPIEYLGVYSEKDLITFIEALMYKPKILHISNENIEDFDRILGENNVLIAFFGDKMSDNSQIFNEIALTSKQYPYIFVSTQHLKKKFNQTKDNVLIFRKCGGANKTIETSSFDDSFNIDVLKGFIDQFALGCHNIFNENLAQSIFGGESLPFFILFLDTKANKHELDIYADFARLVHDEILLTYSEISYGIGYRMSKFVEVSKQELPIIFILASLEDELIKYPFYGEFTVDNLVNFYNKWKNRQIVGYLRTGNHNYSQNTKDNENVKKVKKINAKNFNEKVIDSDKMSIVVFEKPMCKVCKEIIAIVDKFIENEGEFVGLQGFSLDYIDNEIHEIRVGTFPSVYFFVKQKRELFLEEKTEEKLTTFFRKHIMIQQEKIEQQIKVNDEL